MYNHSKWSGYHPGGSSYIVGPFLQNFFSINFQNSLNGTRAFSGGQKMIAEDYAGL